MISSPNLSARVDHVEVSPQIHGYALTQTNEATGHLLQQSVPRPTLAGFEAIRSAGRRSGEHSSLPT